MKHILTAWVCGAASVAFSQAIPLPEALQRASSHRPAVQAAKRALDEAKFTAAAASAAPPTRFLLGATTISGLGANDQDLMLDQPIDIFGKTLANRRAAQATLRGAEATYHSALLTVQTEVVKSYFEAVAAASQRDIATEIESLAISLEKATRRRVEEGKIPEVQLTRVSIELERARQNAELKTAAWEAAQIRFNAALGEETDTAMPVSTAALPAPITPTSATRPDVAKLRADVESAEAEERVAAKSRMPDFNIQGIRSPWGQDPTQYALRFQLTFNLFDHGKARAEAQTAFSRAASLRLQLQDMQRIADRELRATELEAKAARRRVESYERITTSTRDLLAKTQKGFSEGFGTLLDVLEATRALREVEQELVEARLSLNLALTHQLETTGTLLEGVK